MLIGVNIQCHVFTSTLCGCMLIRYNVIKLLILQ